MKIMKNKTTQRFMLLKINKNKNLIKRFEKYGLH